MGPLLCVRHQPSVPLGAMEAPLNDLGVEWRYFDAWEEERDPDPGEMSGLIVLGGEMNVNEVDRHPFLPRVRALMHDALDRDLPVLGICLGAQTLASVLGADVARAPVREIGFRPVTPTSGARDDPVLAPFAGGDPVFHWHEDTFELPPGATLLYTGPEVRNQAFRAGRAAYGVQFHFEVTEAEITAWCSETERLTEVWSATEEDLLSQAREYMPRQKELAAEVVHRFVALIDEG